MVEVGTMGFVVAVKVMLRVPVDVMVLELGRVVNAEVVEVVDDIVAAMAVEQTIAIKERNFMLGDGAGSNIRYVEPMLGLC